MILVTGGIGYIGSHTIVTLLEKGYEVVIIDNLINSNLIILDGIKSITNKSPYFVKGDVTDKETLDKLFTDFPKIDSVIHFAAHKAVGESVKNPLKFYQNNIGGLYNLLQLMEKHDVNRFVFSSSCTVYGQPKVLPVNEDAPIIRPVSPYGNTKKISEEIIEDTVNSGKGLHALSLRYFNPIGAHASALIGELPIGTPNNLLPYITQTGFGIRPKLSVYGDDYNTPDGTCIRDYIDINDLAKAHVLALEHLQTSEKDYDVYNLGTGNGTSVLEIIQAFEKSTHIKLNYSIDNRREGDVEQVWANSDKANKDLAWKAEAKIEDTVLSAWNWEKYYRNKLENKLI